MNEIWIVEGRNSHGEPILIGSYVTEWQADSVANACDGEKRRFVPENKDE